MDRPANNVLQSLNKKLRSQHMHDCVRSLRRIVREKERERENAEGGFASCNWLGGGWEAGGWSWPRKKVRVVLVQNPRT